MENPCGAIPAYIIYIIGVAICRITNERHNPDYPARPVIVNTLSGKDDALHSRVSDYTPGIPGQ